jgi:hypothetical protein
MKSRILALALALAATQPFGVAVQAAEPGVAETASHEALYATMERGVDQAAMLDGILASMRTQYAAMPLFAELERTHTGFIDQVVAAMRPALEVYSERVRLEYRPQMIAVLRAGLTDAEADELAEFYRSPLGQKVQQVASQNYRPDNVLSSIAGDGTPTADQVQADMHAVARSVTRGLTTEEQETVGRKVLTRPAFAKLVQIMPQVAALRAKMEVAPTTPAEDAQVEAAIKDVFERYR